MWRWDQQEPFGVNVPDENPSALGAFEFPLTFQGTYRDKETNNLYNYFRDLDVARGQYLQADPLGLGGGINLYSHVLGSPLLFADPEGLQVAPPNPGLLFQRGAVGAPMPFGKPKDDGSMGGLFPPGTLSESNGGKTESDKPSPESIIEGSKVPPFPGLTDLAECTKGSTMMEPATDKRWKNGGVSIQQEYFCPCGQITRHTIIFNGAIVHDHFRPGPPKPGGD